jgi:hypothetical protein
MNIWVCITSKNWFTIYFVLFFNFYLFFILFMSVIILTILLNFFKFYFALIELISRDTEGLIFLIFYFGELSNVSSSLIIIKLLYIFEFLALLISDAFNYLSSISINSIVFVRYLNNVAFFFVWGGGSRFNFGDCSGIFELRIYWD